MTAVMTPLPVKKENPTQEILSALPFEFPTRKNEDWKYVPLTPVLNTPFASFASLPTDFQNSRLESHYLRESDGQRLVFVNGQLLETASMLKDTQAGLTLCDWQTALKNYQNLLKRDVFKDTDAFAELNARAEAKQGSLVYVAEGVSVSKPVQLLFYTIADVDVEIAKLAQFRNLIVVEKNASVQIVVQFVGDFLVSPIYFNNLLQRIVLEEGASVQLTFLQLETVQKAWQFSNTQVALAEKSNFNMTSIALGGRTTRNSIAVQFNAQNAVCTLNGLSVPRGDSEIYQHTVMNHAQPNNASHQLYKNILNGKTKCEYNGTVQVAVDADGTDSTQMNKNLLLSEDARVYTRPQLQILAHDVKCTHGATVGQLDEDALFYFASRGIDVELAQCLLTYGFAEEIIEAIPNVSQALRGYLDQFLLAQLNQTQNPLTCNTHCNQCD